MWRRLTELLLPFSVIAKELTAIRELYEADLASREKPVYRITESPGKSDTTVTYEDGTEESPRKSKLAELAESWNSDDDEV